MKKRSEHTIFISGIDTNIGKTYATAYLIKKLRAEGFRCTSQKMIQTGNKDYSEDIQKHRELLGEKLQEEDLNRTTAPIILSYPASPHLAAKLDQVSVDLNKLNQATNILLNDYDYDFVLLEGAGGLMVPIREDYLTLNFIQEEAYPLALVTSGRLGSLNHTLLSLEVCKLRQLEVRYLIYNHYPKVDGIIETDSLNYLSLYLEKHFPETKLLELELID
ncbi:ATP-dependent dethiobiotin synthetase BioD 2-like [Globicephala melas]|uniref:ATP-dependent dethiobiotin synthetase BioD 2-like n=1 Tax=Globicephala melas TaxID=9731 RepID=UPI00293D56D1|nr:ATP-dependent dethiobiotin synthetase BioD 2-like [Globicephala melas]